MALLDVSEPSLPVVVAATDELGGGRFGSTKAFGYTALGVAVALAAFLVALGIHGNGPSTYRIDSQWSAFAGLFIMALGIERGLEPFSSKLGPDTDKLQAERDKMLEDMNRATESGDKAGKEKKVAGAQSAVQMGRQLTAVVIWGVATAAGFLLCAALNITLLQAVRAENSGQPPFWADLLLSGLVVGAGTKPLHDLISNLEKKKEVNKDPAQVGGTAP
jgi:hypothetical protein